MAGWHLTQAPSKQNIRAKSSLACDANEELAAFELDTVQFFQNQLDSRFGDVDESFRRLKMDGADLSFGNGGDAGDHANEIAR